MGFDIGRHTLENVNSLLASALQKFHSALDLTYQENGGCKVWWRLAINLLPGHHVNGFRQNIVDLCIKAESEGLGMKCLQNSFCSLFQGFFSSRARWRFLVINISSFDTNNVRRDIEIYSEWTSVCVSVCVWEREREREREKYIVSGRVCVCVFERERERERERWRKLR